MKIDLTLIPFSRRGSYMAISYLTGGRAATDGLWLRSVREVFRSGPLLLIEALRDDSPCAFTDSVGVDHLSLAVDGGGSIDIAFDGPNCVRFLVQGCTLRLSSPGGGVGEGANIAGASNVSQITPAGAGMWRVVMGMASTYTVQQLQGTIQVSADWSGRGSTNNVITVDGGSSAAELAISEGDGLELLRASARDFGSCVADSGNSFSVFKAAQPPHPGEYAEACELAAYLNWSCLVAAEGFLKREGMLMSKNWMTAVWSWDHCFNALALRQGDPELAWNQFLTQFDHQNEQGALPDLVSVRTMIRAYVKPPIHGWTFKQLWDAAPDFYTDERLTEIYQKLEAWTQFWLKYRDPYHTGLPVYYHGNDSGWDNSTSFLAGSPLTSPDLPAFLVLQMDTLAQIAEALEETESAEEWRTKATELLKLLLAELWQDGTWRVLAPATPESKPSPGADSLLPYVVLVLGDQLPKDVLDASVQQLTEDGRFLTQHGLATESVSSPFYEDDGYWRGPIWAPSSMLIIDGLARAGKSELAMRLSRSFCDMCKAYGLAENYDAQTGVGLRDRGYTWTASVFLELASRLTV